jgi:putative transposase
MAMPRPPREQVAGGVYHVFARGNDRAVIFRDDRDRRRYLELVQRSLRRTRWRLLAYCLMDNHVHLIVETPEPNLADGMQWLHGHYGRYFNDRHGRTGHVFQGRYRAVRQRTDEQLRGTIRYVVHNPVSAGLCASPGEYAWSSHRGTAAASDALVDVKRLLWFLDAPQRTGGLRRYADLVDGDEMNRDRFEPLTDRTSGCPKP